MIKTKIIPRIIGGLGNQLFCYAAARRLALVNNAELVIDDKSGFSHDFVHQRRYQLAHFSIPCRKATATECMKPFARLRRYLYRIMNRFRPFAKRSYIEQDGHDFDPRLLVIKPRGTVYLEGYWQSESYFKDVEAIIRSDLRIIPPTDKVNLAMAAHIRDCLAVALHVRFFNVSIEAGGSNIPSDYYSRAIAQLEAAVPGAHYFLFSDQPDAARARILLPDNRVTCVLHNQGDENAYADLWLMTLCRHFIIANSTFSWWGAWLSEYSDKIVIAPGFELRGGISWWGFNGLIPQGWIRL